MNTYFTHDNEEVMTADGILTQKNGKDTLEVSTRFEHFPLKMANAFILTKWWPLPEILMEALYYGSLDKPQMHGDIVWTVCLSMHARREHVTGSTTVRCR